MGLNRKCQSCGKQASEVNEYNGLYMCFNCFNEIEKGGGTMSNLSEYVNRNSKTIMLKDGESVIAVYRGNSIGPNKFDTEKETVNYKLENEYGVKTFSSSALGLARLFDGVEEGTEIRITREGEGNKTRYSVERKIEGQWVDVGLKATEEE